MSVVTKGTNLLPGFVVLNFEGIIGNIQHNIAYLRQLVFLSRALLQVTHRDHPRFLLSIGCFLFPFRLNLLRRHLHFARLKV